MHEKRFEGDIDRLRAPERVERLEVERVTNLFLECGATGIVLDVGTGTGLFAEAFSRRGLEVTGMDANPEMLAAASRYVPKGDFREGTAEALPYPDDSFDFVFLGLVLHESDEPLKALKEARRVARQRVGILEWPYQDGAFGPPLAHRLNPEDLANLFQKVGFRKWKVSD
ncbi:MAG: methyltransferase domain-containing protein, partial [Chloroflexi bacterium]|nr:methyltransferase domain-containing protein [Chloroflexota bacterium]